MLKKELKFLLGLLLTGIVISAVPAAQAQVSVKYLGAGSSAMWQGFALAAYNAGSCPTGAGAVTPCAHWTGKGSTVGFLADSRAAIPNETGNLWVVWDNGGANAKVWMYLSVDSVVGNRCYFASPRCTLKTGSGISAAGSGLISAALWGPDSLIPSAVLAKLQQAAGNPVTAAMTDIRPEDALFAACRANSTLDTTNSYGLGYGTRPFINPPNGTSTNCPQFSDPAGQKIGTGIQSGITGSTSVAQPVAFNISGTDPFTNHPVVAGTTVRVGASPVLFLVNRKNAGGLGNAAIKNGTDAQLRSIFEGTNCTAAALGGANVPISVFLREPLSGTMNTTEFSVFRNTGTTKAFVTADSQEKGVNATNPLKAKPCSSGGTRTRGIGTGEIIKGVGTSGGILNTVDSIGYAFFSFGNVSAIGSSASYGYLQLDGVDPIFANYTGGDPGQPGGGELPVIPNAGCPSGPPCPETSIWSGKLSFPHLRDGSYRAWSVLRLVSDGTNLTNAKLLVSSAQASAVTKIPDFVPFAATSGDPGLKKYRSHYKQSNKLPNNGLSGQVEAGGDVGGCIETVGSAPGVLNEGQKTQGSPCQPPY